MSDTLRERIANLLFNGDWMGDPYAEGAADAVLAVLREHEAEVLDWLGFAKAEATYFEKPMSIWVKRDR